MYIRKSALAKLKDPIGSSLDGFSIDGRFGSVGLCNLCSVMYA